MISKNMFFDNFRPDDLYNKRVIMLNFKLEILNKDLVVDVFWDMK